MNAKNGILILMLLILITIPQINSQITQNNNLTDCPLKTNNENDHIIINVALYTNENESDEEFYSQYRRTRYFVYALRDYEWQVGELSYSFKVDILSTKDLHFGKLNKENYDVMIYAPDMVDAKIGQSLSKYQIRNIIERTYIQRFIEDGGGFFGTCAGSVVANVNIKNPSGMYERVYNGLDLDISAISAELHGETMPLFSELGGGSPKDVGPIGAYYWYSGWNQSNYSINFHTGVCLDVPINKDNPIFDDCHETTRRIRWIGAPAFVLPENPDRKIYVLGTFPEEEMSENESTRIHYWDYKGGLVGLIKGMFTPGKMHYFTNLGPFLNAYCFASDWDKLSDQPVTTNYSNKPFMTAEIYPNENNARIVRCTGHPEHNVWWGGYIEETEDTDNNNQYEAFYRWKNVLPEEQTVEDEFSYNYWIVRRCVAWASKKMPNSHLPPTYGPSEVCEPLSYILPSRFKLIGSTEHSDGKVSLKLYYRHSNDNKSWSEWKYYSTDNDSSDGWSWNFDASTADDLGYYEFYSIRRVDYENHYEIEPSPIMADIKIHILPDYIG